MATNTSHITNNKDPQDAFLVSLWSEYVNTGMQKLQIQGQENAVHCLGKLVL